MVKLIPKAETHFENGETHFKNGETHFKNSETHFFGILRKWPLLDFAQKKSLHRRYHIFKFDTETETLEAFITILRLRLRLGNENFGYRY